MTSMRRRYVASTSLRRHVPTGNLPPPLAPQYSKPSYAYVPSTFATPDHPKLVKDLTSEKQGRSSTIKDKSGKCLTEEKKILSRWTEYCTELYYYEFWRHHSTGLQRAPGRRSATKLVVCLFNGPLRQYFSQYWAVSQREGERRERIDESKNVQTTPTRTYCKRNRPLPYCNQNCRTPRHWKFTQRHRITRPPQSATNPP